MNDRGSATTLMLILLPLILSGAAVAFVGAMSIRITEKTNLICREGLLEAETQILQRMNQLRNLNPAARLLRNANTVSKMSLAIPFYGVVNEMSVQEVRALFHAAQLNLIYLANFEMRKSLVQTQKKLNSSLGYSHTVQSDLINVPTLAVQAEPKFNLTPDYNPKEDFADLMLSQIQWSVQVSHFLPEWLTRYLNTHEIQVQNLSLKLSCSSNVQKKDSQWQASLVEKNRAQSLAIKAKQLLNSYSSAFSY